MKKNVKFTAQGICLETVGKTITSKEIPLYSGSIHYWRMAPEKWETALKNIKKMGFSIVETYIPWAVHEPERGEFDYGETDKRKNLDKFLYTCEKEGLYVIVRPGPHINAEMTWFGYPQWLLKMPEIQARTPEGTSVVYPYITGAFPIPSYASSKLYEETRRYFRSFSDILKKHCFPEGGIIAIQADNETCNFFRDDPYIMDYSKESVEQYRHRLAEKYGTIQKLNETYHSDYKTFKAVCPPVGYQEGDEHLEYYFDWVEYKEYQILEALRKMVKILEELELPIPIFHNCAYQNYTPISVQRNEEIPGLSVAGMDAYPEPEDTSMLKERIRYLTGSSRFPFVPEFGSGSWFDRGKILSPEEEMFGYLYAFMNGMKAVNFYMLVERDRWTGCPLYNDGTVCEKWYEMFERLLTLLKETELNTYTRSPKILVLKNYDMGRLRALTATRNRNIFSSNCFVRGTDIPKEIWNPSNYSSKLKIDNCSGGYDKETWIQKIMNQLDQFGMDYDISDCFITPSKLEQYEVVFAASYNFMESWIQEKLLKFSCKKDKQLYLGPDMPEIDRRGRRCRLLHENKSVKILPMPESFSAECLPHDSYRAKNCEISVHERKKDGSCIIFAANITNKSKKASIDFSGKQTFENMWNHNVETLDSHMSLILQPFEIQIWKVEVR